MADINTQGNNEQQKKNPQKNASTQAKESEDQYIKYRDKFV